MTIKAVRVRGTFHGPTGHDRHVRAFVREFVRAGVDVQLIDMPEWSRRRLLPSQRDPWFDTLNSEVDASVFLQFCMPSQVRRLGTLQNVNYTMFEADRIPDIWVRAAPMSVLTVVPESSSYDAWIESGVSAERLRICPLGVDPQAFGGASSPLLIQMESGEVIAARRTRFLNLSEVVPRKNQRGLLRTWLQATSSDDDAVLIMKIGGAGPEDTQKIRALIPALEQETGKSFTDAAPIVFLDKVLADDDMPRLYAAATHYLTLSFGEGWDLPLMEAAASGLQLIAANHAAYRSYLDASIATLIPVVRKPAVTDADFRVFFEHAHWWEPDERIAIEAIRNAIEGREQAVASPRDYVLGHFTWRHAAARLLEILTEAEQM